MQDRVRNLEMIAELQSRVTEMLQQRHVWMAESQRRMAENQRRIAENLREIHEDLQQLQETEEEHAALTQQLAQAVALLQADVVRIDETHN